MNIQKFEMDYNGDKIIFETGRFAPQANAAVTVQIGETVVLATATMSKEAREIDFFPLMVDYEERFYAAGRILGPRFAKREGRPPEDSILIGRMIDRGLRPRFPSELRNEVQIICYPLSFDGVNKPDVIAMLAAGAALHISDIPFNGPIAAVRIGRIDGEIVINPSAVDIEKSDLQLVLQGDGTKISMVDCDAKEILDEDLAAAFEAGLNAMTPLTEFMDKLREQIGKEKAKDEDLIWMTEFTDEEKEHIEKMKQIMISYLDKYLFNTPKGSKGERKEILTGLKEQVINEFKPELIYEERNEEEAEEYLKELLGKFFYDYIEEQVSLAILDRDQRVDGRALTDIRELYAEVDILPRTHGTGMFGRGETHVFSIVTLGAPGDELSMESIEEEGTKKYFHHYNFPPFCVGEVKPLRGTGRREVGHGALAEKAIIPVLPAEDDFPYTIRVVSEVMSSNGSSSMGSTCSSSLALMDAGVPLKKPVAGIAMGLAADSERWKVLTDLQDLEDGPGGMDFKFTSTRDGITAVQMDCKSDGLNMDIIQATITQARPALNKILDLIETTIPQPRAELSEYAPRITSFMIDPEKIGDVIGPGGKVVRELQDRFEVRIDIEEDGKVLVTSTNKENAELTEKAIIDIVRVVEVGEIFEEAEVVKVIDSGAFVKLTPGTDGMLRVSELSYEYVKKVTDVVNVGDKVKVKVIRIEGGKVEVSMKALLPVPEGYKPPRPRSGGYDKRRSGGRSGGGRSDRRGSRGGDRSRKPKSHGGRVPGGEPRY
jgi:polyribonucleotide nucleotidyltransferase